MGNFLSHTLTLIGFLPTGYVGNGYPLPSLDMAMHGTVEASKLRKGKSTYNPWTHISHKELILIAKVYLPSKQSTTTHAPRGRVGRS